MPSARQTAFNILHRVNEGAYASDLLLRESELRWPEADSTGPSAGASQHGLRRFPGPSVSGNRRYGQSHDGDSGGMEFQQRSADVSRRPRSLSLGL